MKAFGVISLKCVAKMFSISVTTFRPVQVNGFKVLQPVTLKNNKVMKKGWSFDFFPRWSDNKKLQCWLHTSTKTEKSPDLSPTFPPCPCSSSVILANISNLLPIEVTPISFRSPFSRPYKAFPVIFWPVKAKVQVYDLI